MPLHSCWQTRFGFRAIFACSREMALGRSAAAAIKSQVRTVVWSSDAGHGTGAAGDGNASERHALHTRERAKQAERRRVRMSASVLSFVPEVRDGGGSRMNVDTLRRYVQFFIIRVFDRRRTQNEQGIEYI